MTLHTQALSFPLV